jgi:hypothetical protein
MDLPDAVAGRKPRERAGAGSADRLDYQKNWALCKLLALHESTGDYLIAFDIFDDVVVLNGEITPDRISFFQIKTRQTPPMCLTDVLQRKQGKAGKLPSILGKLYYNKLEFPDHVEALTLVSNVPFKINLLDAAAKSMNKPFLRCTELCNRSSEQNRRTAPKGTQSS